MAVGCLSLLVLALLVARALTRWVLRPVDGLERAVAEMTEGVAGLPAHVAGPPELRHFTSAFNTMARTVRASLERQRRLYHAAIGRALEEIYGGRIDEVAELLAFHFGRGDEAEKAVDYAILAAEKAQREAAIPPSLLVSE